MVEDITSVNFIVDFMLNLRYVKGFQYEPGIFSFDRNGCKQLLLQT